jgi:hypothetical protein
MLGAPLILMLMLDSIASVLLVRMRKQRILLLVLLVPVLMRKMGLYQIVSWRLLLDSVSWQWLKIVLLMLMLMLVQLTALYDTIAGVLDLDH